MASFASSGSLASLLLLLVAVSMSQAQVKIFNMRASGLSVGLLGTADGFVKVFCGSASLGQTAVRHGNANPWWEDEFTYYKARENEVIRLEVFDRDLLFNDLLGVCQRQLRVGTHRHDCFLEKGGTLHYSYTLGA